MKTKEITNREDIIDSRDIIERIEYLEGEVEELDPTSEEYAESDEVDELSKLKALQEEAEGSPDWIYGEALIRDSYFEDYARQTAEDCGMLQNCDTWPARCIDWKQAAEELQQDYTSVEFDGVTYWIRA